jgi:hypothetical protein
MQAECVSLGARQASSTSTQQFFTNYSPAPLCAPCVLSVSFVVCLRFCPYSSTGDDRDPLHRPPV